MLHSAPSPISRLFQCTWHVFSSRKRRNLVPPVSWQIFSLKLCQKILHKFNSTIILCSYHSVSSRKTKTNMTRLSAGIDLWVPLTKHQTSPSSSMAVTSVDDYINTLLKIQAKNSVSWVSVTFSEVMARASFSISSTVLGAIANKSSSRRR
jgi:hypothetical protein